MSCAECAPLPLISHSISFLAQRTARRAHASRSSWLGSEVEHRRFRLARASFGPSDPARGRSGQWRQRRGAPHPGPIRERRRPALPARSRVGRSLLRLYAWVRHEDIFDLAWRDVLTLADDHLLGPPGDDDAPVTPGSMDGGVCRRYHDLDGVLRPSRTKCSPARFDELNCYGLVGHARRPSRRRHSKSLNKWFLQISAGTPTAQRRFRA